MLYAYPLLKTVGEDYEKHILNRAVLSGGSSISAERLAEYLAAEILDMRRLEWLKGKIESVVQRLDEPEQTLLSIRYFGKTKRLKALIKQSAKMSERNYFRRQKRLSEKVGAMLYMQGVTEDVFLKDFAQMDIFQKIYKFVQEGRDRKISADERRRFRE